MGHIVQNKSFSLFRRVQDHLEMYLMCESHVERGYDS